MTRQRNEIDQLVYDKITIPGSALKRGFSIYVIEVKYQKERYFYIGMTGDPYYPSARAIIHRVSGHLELNSRSTQNQLLKALKDKGIDESKFDDLTVDFHYFPIPGFIPLVDDGFKGMNSEDIKALDGYDDYQDARKEVFEMEKYLICKYDDDPKVQILNKAIIKADKPAGNEKIIAAVDKIIRDGR